MSRDRHWLWELQAERPELICRRTALAAAESASWQEVEDLISRESDMKGETAVLLARLGVLETETTRLNDLLHHTKNRYNAVAASLQDVDRLLKVIDSAGFPMQDLPSDIARIIFEQAASEDHQFKNIAMSVCKAWRAIVYSTPSFWRRIEVTLNDITPPTVENLRTALTCGGDSGLELHLLFNALRQNPNRHAHLPSSPYTPQRYDSSRTRSYPQVDWFSHTWPGAHPDVWQNEYRHHWLSPPAENSWGQCNYEHTMEAVNRIAPHLHRCTKLFWDVSSRSRGFWTWDACWLARRMELVDFSRLVVLRVDLLALLPNADGHHERAISIICRAASNLGRLSMRHSLWHPLTTTSLDCLELTDCSPTLNELLDCLSMQKSLRTLKLWQVFPTFARTQPIDDAAGWSTSWSVARPVLLPQLKEFFHYARPLDYASSAGSDAFLSKLACPQLGRAIIKTTAWATTLDDTISFFVRSPALDQLALGISSANDLRPVFQALPSVRDFVGIHEQRTYDAIGLDTVFFDSSASLGYLDALEHVSLTFACDQVRLRDWLEARINTGRAIKSFSCYPPVVVGAWGSETDDQTWTTTLETLPVENKAVEWIKEIDWPFM